MPEPVAKATRKRTRYPRQQGLVVPVDANLHSPRTTLTGKRYGNAGAYTSLHLSCSCIQAFIQGWEESSCRRDSAATCPSPNRAKVPNASLDRAHDVDMCRANAKCAIWGDDVDQMP